MRFPQLLASTKTKKVSQRSNASPGNAADHPDWEISNLRLRVRRLTAQLKQADLKGKVSAASERTLFASMNGMTMRNEIGFTVIDLMIGAMVIAMFAAVVLPRL